MKLPARLVLHTLHMPLRFPFETSFGRVTQQETILVVAVGDGVSGWAAGDRVAPYVLATCGTCRYCLAGDQPLCLRAHIMGEHTDGGFAEYVLVPQRCIVPLSNPSAKSPWNWRA